jgi:hypothetical protein
MSYEGKLFSSNKLLFAVIIGFIEINKQLSKLPNTIIFILDTTVYYPALPNQSGILFKIIIVYQNKNLPMGIKYNNITQN